MKYAITSRGKLTTTDGMKGAIKEKLSFLDKFLKEETPVQITISVENDTHKIDMIFPYNGQLIKQSAETSDFYMSLDKLSDTLKNTMSKFHSTLVDKNKRFIKDYTNEVYEDSEEKSKIVKRKNFSMKPMFEEEAILQMNALNHSSFMFLNADLDFTMCLLYKRKDGNYGIIQGIFEEE